MKSHFVTSLGNAKDTVEELLKKHPLLRDSDNRLLANFWNLEMEHAKLDKALMLHHFAAGKLTPAESIRRARQKLQEMNPELRGQKYTTRQVDGESVRKLIHTV